MKTKIYNYFIDSKKLIDLVLEARHINFENSAYSVSAPFFKDNYVVLKTKLLKDEEFDLTQFQYVINVLKQLSECKIDVVPILGYTFNPYSEFDYIVMEKAEGDVLFRYNDKKMQILKRTQELASLGTNTFERAIITYETAREKDLGIELFPDNITLKTKFQFIDINKRKSSCDQSEIADTLPDFAKAVIIDSDYLTDKKISAPEFESLKINIAQILFNVIEAAKRCNIKQSEIDDIFKADYFKRIHSEKYGIKKQSDIDKILTN